jgi:D-glycero-alpha-D-manno-heptose-7-phosphate kinase
MILSRTPYRVSFFGGGTDYPAWFEKHGGAVLVSAIDKFCWVTLRYQPQFFAEHISRACWTKVETVMSNSDIENPAIRGMLEYMNKPDVGFEIHHQGDLPAKSGMGSSSSFIVGLLNAHWALTSENVALDELDKQDLRFSLAKTAVRIEREYVGDTVGVQDQYAAALGGVHALYIEKDGTVIAQPFRNERVAELEKCLLLIYLGTTRHASEIAKHQVAEIGNHDMTMHRMEKQVLDGVDILNGKAPISDFPYLLNEAWALKRKLSPVISSPFIENTRNGIIGAGAEGAKLIGAGAGGFMLAYVRPQNRAGLIEWAVRRKLLPVPFKFCYTGSEIIFCDRSKA